MADVFISYKSEERAFAQTLAHRLGEEGLTVWQDQQQLRGDSEYYKQLAKAVADAKVVCAVWSTLANDSRWLHSEANEADKANKLINVSKDGSRPPDPFNRLQCRDLSGWQGATTDDRYRLLVDDLRRVIARGDGDPVADRWLPPDSRAARAWALIQDETDPERYHQFRAVHGASPQDTLATEHLTDIANWQALPQAPSREKLAAIDQFIQSGPFSALGERAKRLRQVTLEAVEKQEADAAKRARDAAAAAEMERQRQYEAQQADREKRVREAEQKIITEFNQGKAEFAAAQRRRFEELPVTKVAKRAQENADRCKQELERSSAAFREVENLDLVEYKGGGPPRTVVGWGCAVLVVFWGFPLLVTMIRFVLGLLHWTGDDYLTPDQLNFWTLTIVIFLACLLLACLISFNPSALSRDSRANRVENAKGAFANAEAARQKTQAANDEAWKPFQRAIDAFELKRPGA